MEYTKDTRFTAWTPSLALSVQKPHCWSSTDRSKLRGYPNWSRNDGAWSPRDGFGSHWDHYWSLNDRNLMPSDRNLSPSDHNLSASNRYLSPSDRDLSPSDHDLLPSDSNLSPNDRNLLSSNSDLSPSDRDLSPSDHNLSPSDRDLSPPSMDYYAGYLMPLHAGPSGLRVKVTWSRTLCRQAASLLYCLTLVLTLVKVRGSEAGVGYTRVTEDVYNASQYKLHCPPPVIQDEPFSAESRLINCLLDKYARVTTLARPVQDSSASVVIEFGISLIQILDFDEIKQVLTTSMWKNYVWEDQVLRWDPAEFGGVTHIRLPATHLWTPDIVLYNKFGGEGYSVNLGYGLSTGSAGSVQRTQIADEQTKQHEELVAVYFNGTVKWIPPAIYRSSCEINMQDFPFDEQTCMFKFGSWTYDEYKVDLRLYEDRKDIDLREYLRSSEWDVLNTSGVRNIRRYPFFDTDPYPEIIFYLTMRRQSTFYIYLLVLPCILLSCLTLVLFWIPAQRPDRTAVGMSLFSSFFILLLILVQSSPPTSASISRLGIHYCINMVLIAVSTVLSVVIINIGKARDCDVAPKWLMQACLYKVAKLLCIKVNRAVMSGGGPASYDDPAENGVYLECLNGSGADRHAQFTVRDKAVRNFDVAHRWHTLAAILDRCFFIVYLVALVTSTIFIFPSGISSRSEAPDVNGSC